MKKNIFCRSRVGRKIRYLLKDKAFGQAMPAIICWQEPDIHRRTTSNGIVVLNLEQFFDDFIQAKGCTAPQKLDRYESDISCLAKERNYGQTSILHL